MDMFSSSPLMESFPSTRFPSPQPSPTRTEVDLPLDVDQSFNSSMSISCAGDVSPPADTLLSPSFGMMKPLRVPSPGMLSPTPALGKAHPRRPDPVPIQSPRNEKSNELSFMGGPRRTFGRELSTNTQRSFGPATTKGMKGMMLPPGVPNAKASSSKHRGAIPMKWSSSNDETTLPKLMFQPAFTRREVSCATREKL